MARVSNGIITIINLLTLLLSISAIALSVWFYVKIGSPCERMVRMPLLAVGGALMMVSMSGLLGACCRVTFFMWLYLITLFLLIVGLIGFTAFAIVITNKGIGQVISETGVVENGKLGEYSIWLQNYVLNPHSWDRVKGCLIHIKLCETIEGGSGMMHVDIYKQSLSLVQSGCCRPPTNCGMELTNGTSWKTPEKGLAVSDPDCKIWSNDQTQLCYNCESCKTAVLDNVKREWKMLAIINTLILISITIIYSIGCCALRNNRSYGYTKYRSYYA